MIELTIEVEQIPYIRTIEGRKFKNGKWTFPDSALLKLQQLGLVPSDVKFGKKKMIEYEVSDFLRKYQKDIVQASLNNGSFGIFADTGTGKTVMGLEIAKHYRKTLVLCPLSVIETAWVDDCHNFYHNLKIVNVWGNSKQYRLNMLHTDADIYVMNYESFKIIINDIKKQKFDCMIVDESSVMKNMSSQITSAILSMIDNVPHRFVLSGCPTPNHNSEIFPQMKFVNPEVFGNNYYGFLAKYFHQDMANPHYWFQTDEDKERYIGRLREQSIFLRKEDCVDLPDKIFEVKQFTLAKEQQTYYDDILNNIREHINEWSKFEFTAKLMKLREITSGFVINKNQSVVNFATNKKPLLNEVLSEIGDNQVIIWCQFQHEIETLANEVGGGIAHFKNEKS